MGAIAPTSVADRDHPGYEHHCYAPRFAIRVGALQVS